MSNSNGSPTTPNAPVLVLGKEWEPVGGGAFGVAALNVLRALAGDAATLALDWTTHSPPASYVAATNTSTIRPIPHLCRAPDRVEVLTLRGRREHPALFGALAHQAAHQRHTRWADQAQLPPAVLAVANVLEELRVEYACITVRPQDAKYLRAAAISNPPPLHSGTRWHLASYAALTVGRVDSGVHLPQALAPVRQALTDALGDHAFQSLRDMWTDALLIPDEQPHRLVAIAERWARFVYGRSSSWGMADAGTCQDRRVTLGSRGHPDGTSSIGSPGTTGGAEADEFADPGMPGVPGTLSDAARVLADRDPARAVLDNDELAADEASIEQAERRRSQRDSDAKARERAKQRAKKKLAEFPHNDIGDPNVDPPLPDYDADDQDDMSTADEPARQDIKTQEVAGSARPNRKAATFKEPTPEDRALAKKIGVVLRKAQFRERTSVKRDEQVPPGRLRGRELVLGEAQRAMGQEVTARPFRTVRKRHGEEPPLRAGIMVDTSGSMGWASAIMGRIIWMLSHAVTNCDGKVCAVTFGGSPGLVVRPGSPPTNVRQLTGHGGREQFIEGFEVLDGAVDLVEGNGARLLIVVSDGFYSPRQRAGAADLVSRMLRRGGAVLWIADGLVSAPPGVAHLDARPLEELPVRIAEALAQHLRQS